MYLLAYLPSSSPEGLAFRNDLEGCLPGEEREFFESLEAFCQRLLGPSKPGTVVVLMPETPAQLEKILECKNSLGDLPLTVILPSHDPFLVGRAHLLRPRFLTYLDQEPAVLLQVLANIARRQWPSWEGPADSELAFRKGNLVNR